LDKKANDQKEPVEDMVLLNREMLDELLEFIGKSLAVYDAADRALAAHPGTSK